MKITLENLIIPTQIGIYPWEKSVKQNLTFTIQYSHAETTSKTVTLSDSNDYDSIIKHVIQFLSNQHFDLIENCAQALLENLLTTYQFSTLSIELRKPNILPNVAAVVVTVQA